MEQSLSPENIAARRREAGNFLRTRREKLKPEDVGLPQGYRRRTPGLRREEVAMLAGIGTTWYTLLEQGRERQPSNEVLAALCGVLLLDRAEQHHLYNLYDRPPPEEKPLATEQIGESITRMMNQMQGQPAIVFGWRWDVLTYNKAAQLLLGFEVGESVNVIEYIFTSSKFRELFPNWATIAKGALSNFRVDISQYIGDPDLDELIARLSETSDEFAKWWPNHDVSYRLTGRKVMQHPALGELAFDFSTLAVAGSRGIKLFVFTPADNQTIESLDQLLIL